MFGEFSCSGAGYNKSERDNISFRWVGESYLLLYFSSPARVGDEIARPNAVLLYGPGQLRDYGSCGGFVNSYCTFFVSEEIFQSFEIKTGTVFYPENYDAINKLFRKITDEKNNSRAVGENMLLGLVLQLLAETSRGQQSAETAYGGKELRLRRRFEELREEYLSDLINPPDIEEIIGGEYFSRSQFYRLYKRFFGTTPKSDLLDARLDCAKDLLIKTRLTTAEIAAISGFGTPLNLYRSFKGRAGCTVGEWKAANAKKS